MSHATDVNNILLTLLLKWGHVIAGEKTGYSVEFTPPPGLLFASRHTNDVVFSETELVRISSGVRE
jgi:hypothetical protein